MSAGPSRRRFLTAAGAAGAFGTLAAATAGTVTSDLLAGPSPAAAATGAGIDQAVPFHGVHQAGIVTPVQDRLLFASFDLTTADRTDVVDLLQQWTRAARRMTAGLPVGSDNTDQDAPPDDTGEVMGLGPSSLTVTFGFGGSLFTLDGVDRFGLASRRPEALVDLPEFGGDVLEAARSDGDLAVQACANDPNVTFHAIRNLARIARGTAVLRWSQMGFGRTSKTDTTQETPRNLMGFKDGTNNIVAEDTATLNSDVWVGGSDDPAWMQNGSYMVIRRIRMLLEVWDRSTLADQEQTIGRNKLRGAPLGERREHDTVDLTATRDGELVIPVDAHIRLAAPAENGGVRILRRGYSFTDGINEVTNQLDAGLFFIAFQRDPRTGFIRVQQNLLTDALNEYIRHTGSGVFAVPPGTDATGYIGETLFT